MTHSPEPWRACIDEIFSDDECVILAAMERVTSGERLRTDIERIVACVNACAGISTDLLQRAESAAFINDHEKGPMVIIDCGPPLKSRPSVSFPLEEKEPENETP